MKLNLLLALIGLALVGCATGRPSVGQATLPKAINIEFKGKPGESSETRYFSNARILTYEENQIVRDRSEAVDFSVTDHVLQTDPTNKLIRYEVRTTKKDGAVDLHDLAYPELNESIEYVMGSDGRIFQAGRYPVQSLFFVPSLPIPGHAVEVGDTWTMDHSWLSAKDGVPLKLDVVAILKNIVVCEKSRVCADIEISGHVTLVAVPTTPDARFESRLWGRMLFSLDRGDVLWSEMRSRESMGIRGNKTDVTSCMVSEMKSTAKYNISFACDPGEQPVTNIPKL